MSTPVDLMPTTRRGWVVLAVIAIVGVVAFVLVTRFYDAEGGSKVSGGLGTTADPGLIVTVEPVAVDALRGTTTVQFTFDTQGTGLLGPDERLTQNTRVTIGSQTGLSEVRFPAGTVLGQYEAAVGVDGEQADYPFDVHEGFFTISADTYDRAADGSVESTGSMPIGLQGRGGVNGWDTSMTFDPGMSAGGFGGLVFHRAFSTQVFALVILVLAALLAVLALVIGILVHTRRRIVEATLLSWTAALIFALPALRNYMPNAPPIGASIDMYLYLWIMVAAVAAALLVAMAWMTRPTPPARPAASTGQDGTHAA